MFRISRRWAALMILTTKEDAFKRGYKAHMEGKSFYDNPFKEDTREFAIHVDGMVQAIIDQREFGKS